MILGYTTEVVPRRLQRPGPWLIAGLELPAMSSVPARQLSFNFNAVLKPCPTCGVWFPVKRSHAPHATYCSRQCMAAGYRERLCGSANPNYRAAGWHVCSTCGASFHTYNKAQRRCSLACRPHRSWPPKKEAPPKPIKAVAPKLEKKATQPHVRVIRHCVCCDVPLLTEKRHAHYCASCRSARWAERVRIQNRRVKVAAICRMCGKEMLLRPGDRMVTCSPECSRQWRSTRQKGANSHLWKGGRVVEALCIRNSYTYHDWRTAVYVRDDYTCQMCGEKGGKLCVHHILLFSVRPDLRLHPGNGITLCWPCHRSIKDKEPSYEAQFFAYTGGVA